MKFCKQNCLAASLLAIPLVQGAEESKTYGDSTVQWNRCGNITDHPLECAEVKVPMDQFNPANPADKTFTIPMVRMLAKSAKRTILLNPGGPGASGIDMLHGFGEDLNIIIGETYNLLGFDPRGVGRSRPLGSCSPPGVGTLSAGKIPGGPLERVVDFSFDIYHSSGDYYANYFNFAKSCKDVTGEHGAYITTQQAAADMNDILHSIGQSDLDYYGTSYGSVLGTTYAQMFPEKCHRIAIDGIGNPNIYYTSGAAAQLTDVDATWHDVLVKCMEERSTCELAEGFQNVYDLQENITRSIEALREDPVGVYVNTTAFGVLRSNDIITTIVQRLYSPRRLPLLARSLAAFIRGDFLTPYLHFYGDVRPRGRPAPNTGRSEVEGVSEERVAPMETEVRQSDESTLFYVKGDSIPADQLTRVKLTRQEILRNWKPAGYLAQGSDELWPFLQETWQYPKTHNFTQQSSVVTKHPLLILSTSLDPVTPLAAARTVSEIYQGSVLLEQLGPGHCTTSKASKCTARYLKEYFTTGTLPEKGTRCPVDKPYFPDLNARPARVALAKEQTGEQALELALEHLERFDATIAHMAHR